MTSHHSTDPDLDTWLSVKCFNDLENVEHSSDFGQTSDGFWFWNDTSDADDENGFQGTPHMTLWTKDFLDSLSEWVFRGAFERTIRRDIFDSECLIACLGDFLEHEGLQFEYLGLTMAQSWDSIKLTEPVMRGFGADLTWRCAWSSMEHQRKAAQLCGGGPIQVFSDEPAPTCELCDHTD
jgi:hypothetical protein